MNASASNPADIVFTMPMSVTRQQLQKFIDLINKYILEDDDDKTLTMEMVLSTPKLLEYICREALEDGVAMHDPLEFMDNDGWWNIREYLP